MAGMLTNLTTVASFAYKLAMSQLMLDHANHIAQELALPGKKPMLLAEVKTFVAHPDLDHDGKPEFRGTITSSNFYFSFYEGQCWSIVRCNVFPSGAPYKFRDPLPHLAELARTPQTVTTNGAYSLATNWLTRFKVNIAETERKYGKPSIYQLQYLSEKDEKLDTGFYYVQWGPGSDGAVKVSLLGTTGELMELNVYDKSLNHQPTLAITNWQELMATSERKLQKQSDGKTVKPSERSPK